MAPKKEIAKCGYSKTPNHALRNLELSNAGRGLYATMLCLPPNWTFTIRGLAAICSDGVDAIRSQIAELERLGYLSRTRKRDGKGRFGEMEYAIVGMPDKYPFHSVPALENPPQVNPTQENPTQIIKDKTNTHQAITESISFPSTVSDPKRKEVNMRDVSLYREIIKENIAYQQLLEEKPYDRDRIDELLELIVETVCSTKEYIRVAGTDCPAEVVRARFMKLDVDHIRFVFDCLAENTSKIRNIKQYLLTTLYNAPTTIGNYYSALVQHDMNEGCLR